MDWILFLSLLLLAGFSVSASSLSISDDLFSSQVSILGRNLLQAPKPCPVNFEFQNYSIITTRCKGPQYLPNLCCQAFKDFACPFAQELNDLSNDCANTMFSYINLYGKYPPGLFASFCKEGQQGLECPALPPSELADTNGSHVISTPYPLLMLTAAFLIVLFRWF